jgi:hypothetical protein
MKRFHPSPSLTALALILAATQPATAQDLTADSYIPQEPLVPLHELIPSELDEDAAAEGVDATTADEGDGDFIDPPVIALPDLDLLPIAPSQGGAVALDPDAPEAVIPEGWQVFNHFGLSFAVPADFTLQDLQNELYDDEGLATSYARIDQATFTGLALMIAFFPDEMASGFLDAMIEEFQIDAPETRDEPVQIAGLRFVEHRATGEVEGGMTIHVRALMGEMRLQNGRWPAIMMVRSNMDPEVADDVEAGFLASLSIPDPALLGLPDPEPFRDGLMTYRILPGWRSSGGISPDFEQIRLSGGYGTPTQARIELGDVGTEDWSMRNFIEYEFRTGPDAISEGVQDGVPVWIFEGQPAFTLSGGQRTTEGDAWRRYSMVTQVCLPERGPLAATLITTEDRITSDLTPGAVLGGLRLHFPPEATPCPATVTEAVTEAMLALGMPVAVAPGEPDPDLQPSDGPAPPPPPVAVDQADSTDATPPPVVVTGKPDTPEPLDPAPADLPPTPDPEAEAWAQLSTAPTVDGTYAYLRSWPDGAHAAQARDWLQARGIVPPGAAPARSAIGPTQDAEAWARIAAEPTVDAVFAYLRDWPDGAHAAQARDWLQARGIVPPATAPIQQPTGDIVSPPPSDDEFAFAQANSVDTAEAYWTYLKAFPMGRFAQLARFRLARLGVFAPH